MFDGELIRAARKRKGMSQEVLAAGCELSVKTISNVESGRIPPSPETITAIASVLEARPEDFLLAARSDVAHEGNAVTDGRTSDVDPYRSAQMTPGCLDLADRAYSVVLCGALIVCLTCLTPGFGPMGIFIGSALPFVVIPRITRSWSIGSRSRIMLFGIGNCMNAILALVMGSQMTFMADFILSTGSPSGMDLHALAWAGTFATTGGSIGLASTIILIAIGLFGRNIEGRRGPWCYADNWRAMSARYGRYLVDPDFFRQWSP